MVKTFKILTLGCKTNQYDSYAISQSLINAGLKDADHDQKADIYVINSCTVTERTDRQSRQLIYQSKRQNPKAKIIVTGCWPQISAEKIRQIKEVDFIIGHNEKFNIVGLLNKKNHLFVSKIKNTTGFFGDSVANQARTRAFLKIQDGCNNRCSYCIVPFARGFSRSLPFKQVLENFNNLLKNDFKEIVITGVNLSDYGKDLDENLSLYKIISKLSKIKGDFRLRISSLEPIDFDPKLIALISKEYNICKHVHIPIQSASNSVLKRMNRPYNVDYIKKLFSKFSSKIPGISIGTDIICGFPGETETEFNETLEFLKKAPIAYMHVFPYSLRDGTKSATFNDKIHPEVKKQRAKILRELSLKKHTAFLKKHLGRNMQILVERGTKDNLLKGFTTNYIPVIIPKNKVETKNTFINVNLNKIKNGFAHGQIN